MALIEFRHVRKSFGDKVVYSDLTLDVHRGELLTIIGGSGQGKSVMLKLLTGLLEADGGSIRFDGMELVGLPERARGPVRRRIGMLFQGSALFDSLTVRENVAYGLREHLRLDERQIDARVAEALVAVGLPGIESMWPSDLSGGMRKRVGLARAIAYRPEVLLYDEPTTGLDPINTTRINQLIVHLKRSLDVTSVVVTHDMQSAFGISDRIAMIHEGRVIFEGSPEALRRSSDPRVRAFIEGAAPDDEAELAALHGRASATHGPPPLR
ncbi:MAG: ABC transporter ATP-binding protein [Myxococcota bacterium]|nr:ABC transporter ATP-binding protein [Myxococcota bacterium]MDW8361683.1 ABC transporter ATP-binding protein [Myxococcales bacterium]